MANQLYIEHNPFIIETKVLINDVELSNSSELGHIKFSRLQEWIENFFYTLHKIYGGGRPHFDIVFKGVTADFLDIAEAAQKAEKDDLISYSLKHIPVKESEQRLTDIKLLMEEAQQHPIFKDKFVKSVQKNCEDAFNKDFDVFVAATMSAGKSTLINAMLGCDLLPAANEATTATIARIVDNDSMPEGQFNGRLINKNHEIIEEVNNIELEKIKEWNSLPDTELIDLEGKIIGIRERDDVRLVLTDTPGPNNSQDKEHHRTTMRHIQDSTRKPIILYVLNATQLGTNDDQAVLSEIAELMKQGGKQAKDRFIFVVNKIDVFDPEKGESVKKALENVANYLSKNGIENAAIYPVSALLTYLERKQKLGARLTRAERHNLAALGSFFLEEESMNLMQYMPLNSSVRKAIEKRKLSELERLSGVPAVETLIDEYINRYNFPHRINRAYEALEKTIQLSSQEQELEKSLGDYKNESLQIQQNLDELLKQKDLSQSANAKIESFISDNRNFYPSEALQKIQSHETTIRRKLASFGNDFSEEKLTINQAKGKLKTLTSDINMQAGVFINYLDEIIKEAQDITKERIHQIFTEHVREIFSHIPEIPLPILTGLCQQVENIVNMEDIALSEDDIQQKTYTERVQVGTRTEIEKVKIGTKTEYREVKVDERSIFNPKRWFFGKDIFETKPFTVDVFDERSREVPVYEDQTRIEKYVDAEKLWESRSQDIYAFFNELTKAAKEKLDKDTESFCQTFASFMSKEFEDKVKGIIQELQTKIADKAKIEENKKIAEEALTEIKLFKAKLEKTLSLEEIA